MNGLDVACLNGAYVAFLEGHSATLVEAVVRARSQSRDDASIVWIDECHGNQLYQVVDGVAVIGVYGLLVPALSFHGSDYITGYNGIRLAAATALADPEVKAIAYDHSSGGGYVNGCFELVEFLRSVSAELPTMAIVRDLSASAAYALASTADVITVPQTGAVGSIGIVRMHGDYSKMFESFGVDITLIHSGARKVDGTPYKPLPDDVNERWQKTVDAYRDLFADHVAEGRGIDRETILKTEAELYDGPVNLVQAKDLGLIDQIMSPDQAFEALVNSLST